MLLESTGNQAVTRGSFIVFEGVDRCGKTTQVQRLLQKCLSLGLAATAWRFPDRTTATGHLINQYLQSSSSSSASSLSDESIHLLFAANRWEAATKLQETLRLGQHIICDRYAFSGVAFSSAKPGLTLEWCQAPDRGLPAPDCVIFLDVDPAQAEQRGGYGEERYETKDFQTRVRQRFADLQALDTETPWHVVNAAQTMDQVEADIWEIVQQVLQTVADEQRPIGKLWTSTTANTSTTAAATTTTTTTTTTNAVKPTTTQAEESR